MAAQKCLTESDQHALALREVVCQKTELNKKIIEDAYNKVVAESKPQPSIIDKIEFDTGVFIVGVGFGALIVGSHCFGLCR